MQFLALAALGLAAVSAPVSAQADYATGLLDALRSFNLTTLATLAQAAPQLVTALQNGGDLTVFAPTNAAFRALGDAANNVSLVTATLSYHIVRGDFAPDKVATLPSHSVARTFLNDTAYVKLPNNLAQVQVFYRANGSDPNQNVTVYQTAANTTSTATATYQNLRLYVIPRVLAVPGSLTDTLTAAGATSLLQVVGGVQNGALANALNAQAGITLFAPTNAAIAAVSSVVTALSPADLVTVLSNHIINGTAVYNPALPETAISAAGAQFTFSKNSTGTYVKSGNVTARVVRTDLISNNGVVHTIDQVLANTESNPGAASSAYTSATGAATNSALPTGTGSGNGNGNGAVSSVSALSALAAAGLAAVGGAAWTLF